MPIRMAVGTMVEKPCKQAVFACAVSTDLGRLAEQNARSRLAEPRNA